MNNLKRWTLNLRDGLVSDSPTAKYLHGDPPMMRDIVEVVDIEQYRAKVNELVDTVIKIENLSKEVEQLKSQLDTANKLLIDFAGKDGYDKVNEYFLNLVKEQYK